ncbi:two-component system response regulator YesN [Mobilisporobacter senegalensis]|uniref:Stage 0 sporulation protein A homolog n=1 Tax=Mobilisporobacter senegalensis TaxID=1329262 RepID=A0A3N1XNI2_9FIRM|nr:response regulator [Mobilisporobacter senegalensis]ROR28235.1 two-component system response regulator YesN [Mobilisporobacter senegalensis]
MIKVMIVDDERNIREGIIHLINWRELGCEVVHSCNNGSAALLYMEGNPVDIVVTDIKMPIMDGIELSEKISQKYGAKIIILTAYSDFGLAKQAIKYNVSDFIVKNEFIEELPISINKTIEKIVKEREMSESGTSEMPGSLNYVSIFQRLITTGEISEKDIEEGKLQENNYVLCACDIGYYDRVTGNQNMSKLLNNILRISLKDCSYSIIPFTDSYLIITVRYKKNSPININTIVDYFNSIIIMIEEFMNIDMKLGLSSEIKDIAQLKKGYEEARQTLAKITTEGTAINVYTSLSLAGAITDFDVDRYTNMLLEMTFDEESQEAEEKLAEGFERLADTGYAFEQCQLYMLVICSSIIHKAVKYHLDVDQDFNEMEREVYEKIQNAKTIYSLILVGNHTIKRVRMLCIGKKNFKNELIKKVDECIRKHYKEELNLQYISNELYLNSSYVSRAYKKLTGHTVTEKIAMYRVGKAKELLAGTNTKIYEIAQAVGFKDAPYFTNVFVKYTGMSPSEFRQEQ